jgi:hypothetical protein
MPAVPPSSSTTMPIWKMPRRSAPSSAYVSYPGAYISEGLFWRDDIDATDRDELYSDQSVAFALS